MAKHALRSVMDMPRVADAGRSISKRSMLQRFDDFRMAYAMRKASIERRYISDSYLRKAEKRAEVLGYMACRHSEPG